MKKSRVILMLAIVALLVLSCTTAFAATYDGRFASNYTTSQSVSISTNGYIHMINGSALYWTGSAWLSSSTFKTYALYNGSPFASIATSTNTDYTFDYTGPSGTGKLKFSNEYSPWTGYTLWNNGEFH